MKVWVFLLTLALSFAANASVRACEALRGSLYSKPTIEIRMVFGYKDARPARFVGDRHERLAFISHITTACAGQGEPCGFARDTNDADLFTKTIWIGGREKSVRLLVVNSSVGSDDEENVKDPFQIWKSRYALRAFYSGFGEADVVFYNGHSRFGGGPDFRPPSLAPDGTVDPTPYQTWRPGLKKLVDSFDEVRRPKLPAYSGLKILGLFSCSSSQHFDRAIRNVSNAALIDSRVLMYYSDALSQSLSALGDLLDHRCPKSLNYAGR